MELYLLRSFLAVAEARSFSGAARATHSTQSALSRQIARLEKELGVQLFERYGRHVECTPTGQLLLPLVEGVVAGTDRVISLAREQAGTATRKVRFGAVPNVLANLLAPILVNFLAESPDMSVDLVGMEYAPTGWAPNAARISQAQGAEDKDWKRMLSTPVFWVLAILFTIGTTSGLMVIGHASPIAQDVLGISPGAAGAVVSYLAIGMVLGKIGWGVLSDRIGRYPVFVGMLIVAAIALLVMWRGDTYLPVVLGICAVGFCYGGFFALMGPVTAETFGNKNLGINFGIMFLTVAIAAYVGPRLAAAVYEANGGDYGWAFIIAAIFSAAGLLLVGAYMLLARRRVSARTEGRTRLGGHVEEVNASEA